MKIRAFAAFLFLPALGAPAAPDSSPVQRAELELLENTLVPSAPPETGRIDPFDRTWEDWVRRTGELPPDFSTLPSQPFLPDPLLREGRTTPIATRAQWEEQRRWIRSEFEHWVFGRMPPAPGNVRVASSREHREGTVTVRDVLLEFGPDHRAKLHLKLMIPDGTGPFPVFLTNVAGDNLFTSRFPGHDHSFWVRTAVNRGYIACYYQATDPGYGAPDDSDAYIDLYPQYDFSCLARWAWAGSRAIDYLVTLPEVNRAEIGISGHSRNGKQALLAAAFDDRIGAVVASSGLTGEVLPFRYNTDPFAVESIELATATPPHWFHPRLRFFAGREDKLPVDQNLLMALVAPRGLMLASGYSEYSSNAFGSEEAYRSVRRVYRFLGREDKVWLDLRPGDHNVGVGEIEKYFDFFDTVFGRRPFAKIETWIHGFDFGRWQAVSGVRVDPRTFPAKQPGDFLGTGPGRPDAWASQREELRAHLRWALGEEPPALPVQLARTFKENSPPLRNPIELVLGRPEGNKVWQDRLAAVGMGVSSLPYGPGLSADLFYPLDGRGRLRGGKLPVVVWLHPLAYDAGWSAKEPWRPVQRNFILDQRPSIDSLVRRGFIVLAFDQIGFGDRSQDARLFYERYPQWSLMGRMVSDTEAVVAAAANLDEVDPARIYLLGYSLGAKVGLLTAALDDKVCGVAAVCGVDALRRSGPGDGTEGLRFYSHLHGLVPKLGFFLGQEKRVPFDYDEVLALAAPRPVLAVAPALDRYAPVQGVREEVAAARRVYESLGKTQALELWTPQDFNRFPRRLQEEVFSYLERLSQSAAVHE